MGRKDRLVSRLLAQGRSQALRMEEHTFCFLMCMSALPECASVNHMHAGISEGQKRVSPLLEMES